MNKLDVASTFVAGIAGAFFLLLLGYIFLNNTDSLPTIALAGFVLGVGVQSSVRLAGVS